MPQSLRLRAPATHSVSLHGKGYLSVPLFPFSVCVCARAVCAVLLSREKRAKTKDWTSHRQSAKKKIGQKQEQNAKEQKEEVPRGCSLHETHPETVLTCRGPRRPHMLWVHAPDSCGTACVVCSRRLSLRWRLLLNLPTFPQLAHQHHQQPPLLHAGVQT